MLTSATFTPVLARAFLSADTELPGEKRRPSSHVPAALATMRSGLQVPFCYANSTAHRGLICSLNLSCRDFAAGFPQTDTLDFGQFSSLSGVYRHYSAESAPVPVAQKQGPPRLHGAALSSS